MSSISNIYNEDCMKKCMKYCYKGKKYAHPDVINFPAQEARWKIFGSWGKNMISERGGM